MCSATAVVKAMTSWRTSASISLMRATVKLPRSRMASAADWRDEAEAGEGLRGGGLDGRASSGTCSRRTRCGPWRGVCSERSFSCQFSGC